ncbi:MAG: HpcH/HpaI aldolase family protein [Steroidobacteraceae bacterium]
MNRLQKILAIRNRLRNAEVSLGSWMQLPDASVAEIMGRAGYDWIAVDLEHGSIGRHQLPDLFRALELGGTLPLARLSNGSATACKSALDAGAGGVIVPMIESAEQVQRAVQACRWPPAGTRGVGFSRANLFGEDFETYLREAQEPLLVAQIEHVRALESLEAILKSPGLDAIMIGPYDLSASLGLTAQFEHPEFKQVLARIRDAARTCGVPSGVHVVAPDRDALGAAVKSGHRFIAYGIDAVFLAKSSHAVPVRP